MPRPRNKPKPRRPVSVSPYPRLTFSAAVHATGCLVFLFSVTVHAPAGMDSQLEPSSRARCNDLRDSSHGIFSSVAFLAAAGMNSQLVPLSRSQCSGPRNRLPVFCPARLSTRSWA